MEGNQQPDVDGTDSASIRPVSSLLSHFENLSHRPAPSARATSPHESVFLKTPENGDDSRLSSRISLDLPRCRSPWTLSSDDPPGDSHDQINGFSRPPRSPGRRPGRPISMNLHSSPLLTPVLKVESPQSPPREYRSTGDRNSSPPSRESRSPPVSSVLLSTGGGSLRSSSRPATPQFGSSAPPEPNITGGSLKPTLGLHSGRQSPIDRNLNSASLPPPVNRADKPKISTKPTIVTHPEADNLVTGSDESSARKKAVSPFSTPPSSPEKFSSSMLSMGKSLPSAKLSSQAVKVPAARKSLDERRLFSDKGSVRDEREPEFSRKRRPVPQSTRDPKPLTTHTSPCPPMRPDLIGHASVSANRSQMSDGVREPPNLPPRQRPNQMLNKRGLSPNRDLSNSNPTVDPLPKLAKPVQHAVERKSPHQVPREPSFTRDTKPGGVPRSASLERTAREAEDDSQNSEQASVPRIDYPDSSQTNRQPPHLKSGPREISTGYDTRLFDACGKYVCTTGYLTRVWDVMTGELIMSLSHGETVKCMSLAFKPGKGLEDEGLHLWLGTSIGELHEVDIQAQSIVASRSYPSRREIIKIARHQKEMWTLDDEGRLLVWPPDENGTPNLLYSYHDPHGRVARGHTFSMVVGDTLWLAVGKDVHIYRPNARDDVSFKVLKRPLGVHHSGDVTSGTYCNKQGGRAYLGHADGRVTIYSTTDYTCLASVNVSAYKINCLGIVGDYLWAAYKTGMIYIYDVTTNPWIVKKDWRAHDGSVSSFCLDASSVWQLNRLQVTSLGMDNCIRLWDGMLEDDWLETRMQSRDVEYCTFREIRASVLTWNAGASVPGSVKNNNFIHEAVHSEDPPEILVFGFQELVDLEDKKITAKSLLLGSKKKEIGDKEHMSRQYRVWMEHLTRCINDCMPLEESYVLLHTANLIGLFTCIFVKHKERERITNLSAAEVKRGMGGLHGNKGALIVRFVLDDSSLCFVNCHLAAGQAQTASRNNDIAGILESEALPPESSPTTRVDRYVGGGDGTMIMDHEICILNGDLNYRIDSVPRHVIIEAVRNKNLAKLLDRDQLVASRRKNPGFRLRSFVEAPITFAPTYKYDVGSDEYDSSDKKRLPAWCDRILYRGLGRVKQLEYRRHEVRASDHRPVSASFKLRIKTVDATKRATTWMTSQQEFQTEKRRLASDASIEYIINVLGIEPQQARALIIGDSSKKSGTRTG